MVSKTQGRIYESRRYSPFARARHDELLDLCRVPLQHLGRHGLHASGSRRPDGQRRALHSDRARAQQITCRAVGPIKTPDGESFEDFIRKAFVSELVIGEIYAPTAPVTITGNVDSLDFSSGLTDAAWDIALTVRSSNGRSLSAKERYPFTASYYGETGCNNTAHALMPAVQNLVGKVVRDAVFPELLK